MDRRFFLHSSSLQPYLLFPFFPSFLPLKNISVVLLFHVPFHNDETTAGNKEDIQVFVFYIVEANLLINKKISTMHGLLYSDKIKGKQSRREKRVSCGGGIMSVERMLRKSLEGASHRERTGKPCLWERSPSREQLP